MTIPTGWDENHLDGSAVCPHRDLSVCTVCRHDQREHLVEIMGRHYWADNEADLIALIEIAEGAT